MVWRNQASSTARGYGAAHRRLRKQWEVLVNAGGINCWRCGYPIAPYSEFHLGHSDWDRSVYMGAEHVSCNLGGAAHKSNLVRPRRTIVDRW